MFKNIVSVIVTDVKTAGQDVKDFVQKAIPVIETILTDAEDILKGVTPPSTGNKYADDLLKVISILAPYYAGNTSALQAEIQEIATWLEGASAAL